jgi:hypothetical protein
MLPSRRSPREPPSLPHPPPPAVASPTTSDLPPAGSLATATVLRPNATAGATPTPRVVRVPTPPAASSTAATGRATGTTALSPAAPSSGDGPTRIATAAGGRPVAPTADDPAAPSRGDLGPPPPTSTTANVVPPTASSIVSPTPTPTIIVASDGPNQVGWEPGRGFKAQQGGGGRAEAGQRETRQGKARQVVVGRADYRSEPLGFRGLAPQQRPGGQGEFGNAAGSRREPAARRGPNRSGLGRELDSPPRPGVTRPLGAPGRAGCGRRKPPAGRRPPSSVSRASASDPPLRRSAEADHRAGHQSPVGATRGAGRSG